MSARGKEEIRSHLRNGVPESIVTWVESLEAGARGDRYRQRLQRFVSYWRKQEKIEADWRTLIGAAKSEEDLLHLFIVMPDGPDPNAQPLRNVYGYRVIDPGDEEARYRALSKHALALVEFLDTVETRHTRAISGLIQHEPALREVAETLSPSSESTEWWKLGKNDVHRPTFEDLLADLSAPAQLREDAEIRAYMDTSGVDKREQDGMESASRVAAQHRMLGERVRDLCGPEVRRALRVLAEALAAVDPFAKAPKQWAAVDRAAQTMYLQQVGELARFLRRPVKWEALARIANVNWPQGEVTSEALRKLVTRKADKSG